MSFIKSCYGNIGKWRSTMLASSGMTTLPLTVKIVGEIVIPFEIKNAVSNYISI